ncbi:MAG: DNA translocase FtsK 4TM domain-containing protein, partial [Rhodothermales bacterium]
RRKSTQRSEDQLVSSVRKKEILGLILMVLAVLLGVAVVTYSASDDAIARAFTFSDAFDPGNNRATNALGLVGAVLSRALVPSFLGYVVLVLTGLLFAWGYMFFRQRQAIYLPLVSVLLIAGAFTLACLFGWIALVFGVDLLLWSGEVGLGIAGWLQRILGNVGSVGILLLLLAITSLLLVDHDIQRTFDRLEDWARASRVAFSGWMTNQARAFRDRKVRRREVMEEKRNDRRAPDELPMREAVRVSPSRPQTGDGLPRPLPRPVTTIDLFQEHVAPPAIKRSTESREPELRVVERIQEEKADSVARKTEVPNEKISARYIFPPIDLLDERDASHTPLDYGELEENKRILLDKLETHNIEIASINAIVGPTVTLYELSPAPGIKISRITALEDDLAMATAARGIRMIAPIPGKSAVGVEIPNRHRELVPIRDLIGTARFRDSKMELPIPIGKTIEGEVFMQDLTKLPHLLIAGATGSGKSVGLNALIAGLHYACHPANLKFVMIDPKK